MKLPGISTLALTLPSLVLWFINWLIGTFFLLSYGYSGPLRHVGQTASFLRRFGGILCTRADKYRLAAGFEKGYEIRRAKYDGS